MQPAEPSGIVVRQIEPDSSARKSGLRRGDRVISVNNEPVADELDFFFFCSADQNTICFFRHATLRMVTLVRDPERPLGIVFVPKPIRRCGNRCIFCFIDQMPKGLRRPLYVKDEDFRHSFVYGNYVTLSTARQSDLENIVRISLSPLYVSVHATDTTVRRAMLRNARAPDILYQLRWLAGRGIRLHTQIVVCPGFNDGAVLAKSLADLMKIGPAVLSIAVVPVGLTRFRSIQLTAVDKTKAVEVIDAVSQTSDRDAARHGTRRIFLADEFFIKAGKAFPATRYYEDFPQLENGVGLIRTLLTDWQRTRRRMARYRSSPKTGRQKQILVVTGESASPYISGIIAGFNHRLRHDLLRVVTVRNNYLGEMVTVAGLLTARDIIGAVRKSKGSFSAVIAPQVIFNYRGFTLDGCSRERLEKRLGATLHTVSSVAELLDITRKVSQ